MLTRSSTDSYVINFLCRTYVSYEQTNCTDLNILEVRKLKIKVTLLGIMQCQCLMVLNNERVDNTGFEVSNNVVK